MAAGVLWLLVLNSLEGLGLGRDHEGGWCGARYVPGVKFRSGRGLRGLGGHDCIVGWWRLREAWRLSIFLESGHSRWAGAVATLDTVMHHGLSGRCTGARAAGAGGGKGVGLHQFGLRSLRILPAVRNIERSTQ